MTEIEVRRCVVRVVRRGGWSWGPDPRRLRDEILAAVPAVIARALESALPPGADGEVHEPLRVRIPVRRQQLDQLVRAVPPGRAGESLGLDLQLEAAVRRSFEQAGVGPTERPDDAGPPEGPRTPGPTVLAVLLAWDRAGSLRDLLGRLPAEVLACWHDAVFVGAGDDLGREIDRGARAEVGEAVRRLPGWLDEPVAGDAGRLRRRLAAAVLIAAQTGRLPGHPAVRADLDTRFGPPPSADPSADSSPGGLVQEAGVPLWPGRPGPGGAGTGRTRTDAPGSPRESGHRQHQTPPDDVMALAGSPADRASSGSTRAPQVLSQPVQIASALPYLALVQLSRVGWIATLAAGVAAADLDEHWPTLAGALACSVLGAPSGPVRPWEDMATAAAFAGVAPPCAHRVLPARASLLAPPLDAVLGRSLVDGHDPAQPLVRLEAPPGEGAVLFDGQGMFPIAWADESTGLDGWVEECPGCRMVTGSWPAGTAHAGAPHAGTSDAEVLGRAGRALAGMRARRALAPADGPALGRTWALAGGTALASIAWTLWGQDEQTEPDLAIERLQSLTATVQVGPERVRVVLPLGARALDLHRHGLLGEVPDVPWLGARPVEIMAG